VDGHPVTLWTYLPQPSHPVSAEAIAKPLNTLHSLSSPPEDLERLNPCQAAHALVRLTVDDHGHASGRFLPGYTSFMIACPHDRPPRATIELVPGDTRPCRIDPALLDDWSGRFVTQLAAPSAERLGQGAQQILLDVATGSQARTRPAANGDGHTVEQHGPLRLWDAVEDAIETWQRAESPHPSAFGLTITPQYQRVWLGNPDGPAWDLPV
jgi:hypothetical protein